MIVEPVVLFRYSVSGKPSCLRLLLQWTELCQEMSMAMSSSSNPGCCLRALCTSRRLSPSTLSGAARFARGFLLDEHLFIRRTGIDAAPAMIGWDFSGGGCHPVFDGLVVCKVVINFKSYHIYHLILAVFKRCSS